jgi:hypothetical protein
MIAVKAKTTIAFALTVLASAPQQAAAWGSAGHGSHFPILQPDTVSSMPPKRISDVTKKSATSDCLYFLDENDDGINDLITDSDGDGIPDGRHFDRNPPSGYNPPSNPNTTSGRNGVHYGTGFRLPKRDR